MAQSKQATQQTMQFPFLQGLNMQDQAQTEGITEGITPQQLVTNVMRTYGLSQQLQAEAMILFGGLQYLAGVYNITTTNQDSSTPRRANRTQAGVGANTGAGVGSTDAGAKAPSIDAIVLEGINLHPEGCTTSIIRDWVFNYLSTNYPQKKATHGQVVNALNRHWNGQRLAADGAVGPGLTPTAWYPLNSPKAQEVGAATGPGTKSSQAATAQGQGAASRRTRARRTAAG